MRAQALLHGHIAGLDALFLEASAADGHVLDVAADHLLLEKLGFRKVKRKETTIDSLHLLKRCNWNI